MRALSLLLVLAGCNKLLGIPGEGDLSDGGPGDALPPGVTCEDAPAQCALHAIDRSLTHAPDTLTLEGTFGNLVSVTFPGTDGDEVLADVLGPNRAQVAVPPNATRGELEVRTAGVLAGRVPFSNTTYPLGISHFQEDYHQTTGARQGVALEQPRLVATAVTVRDTVYVIGGISNASDLNTHLRDVEAAPINADGTLGKFLRPSGVTLVEARSRHATVTIGKFVYAIGGAGPGVGNFERAEIDAQGKLGAFATAGTLAEPRLGATATVIGNGLYLIGGAANDGTVRTSVERATIGPDGSVGTFELVAGVQLEVGRASHTATVIGTSLYVVGGLTTGGVGAGIGSVERAAINPDGTLGPFAVVPNVTLRTDRGGHSAVLVGRELIVMGGLSGLTSLQTIETAEISDTGDLGTFSASGSSLSNNRFGAATVIAHDELYLIGGGFVVGATPQTYGNADHASLNAGGGFDTLAIASFAFPDRRDLGFAVIGRGAFTIGGTDGVLGGAGSTQLDKALVGPDGALAAGFQRLTALTLVGPRLRHPTAVMGSSVFLLGGTSDPNLVPSPTLRDIEALNIDIDGNLTSGSTNAQLDIPRESTRAVAIGSSLYVLGGRNQNNALGSIAESTVTATGSITNFTQLSGISFGVRSHHCVAVIRNRVHLVGGQGNNGNPLSSTVSCTIDASRKINSCVNGPTLNATRRAPTCIVIGNAFYVLGGDTGANKLVERSDIQADGSLGAFGQVNAAISLVSARDGGVGVMLGNSMHVLGGNTTGVVNAEQAVLR
jgi:hypothetical protein